LRKPPAICLQIKLPMRCWETFTGRIPTSTLLYAGRSSPRVDCLSWGQQPRNHSSPLWWS